MLAVVAAAFALASIPETALQGPRKASGLVLFMIGAGLGGAALRSLNRGASSPAGTAWWRAVSGCLGAAGGFLLLFGTRSGAIPALFAALAAVMGGVALVRRRAPP
jgi:uncharacterized membrane protein HdeD (DUF308 family)